MDNEKDILPEKKLSRAEREEILLAMIARLSIPRRVNTTTQLNLAKTIAYSIAMNGRRFNLLM